MSEIRSEYDLRKTRNAMSDAGWKFAIDSLPGAYIPGPEVKSDSTANYWVVQQSAVRELVARMSQDPELLKLFSTDNE